MLLDYKNIEYIVYSEYIQMQPSLSTFLSPTGLPQNNLQAIQGAEGPFLWPGNISDGQRWQKMWRS